MQTETYHRLRSTTGKLADEHYHCMQSWLNNRMAGDRTKKCLGHARKYQRALEAELKYLKTRPQTAEVIRRITQTIESLELVTRDLKHLTEH
jgi:hypothetical protein